MFLFGLMLSETASTCQQPENQVQKARPAQTKVVLLGTGVATAIVVGDSTTRAGGLWHAASCALCITSELPVIQAKSRGIVVGPV